MDSDGAATELVAVQDHVVSFRAHLAIFTSVQQRHVFGFRTCERMVNRDPALVIWIKGQQWEINDPKEVQCFAVFNQISHGGNLSAHATKDITGLLPSTSVEEDEIILFNIQLLDESFFFLFSKELPERTLVFQNAIGIFFYFDESELLHLHSGLGGDLVQSDHLACGDPSKAFGIDGTNDAATVQSATEDLEAARREDICHVHDFIAITCVWLVRTEAIHRFLISDALEGERNVHAPASLKHRRKKTFDDVDDVFSLNKAGFDIDLGEFRLTVGAQVFITEAAGDLEVTLETRNHEELFVLLRSLRQGKELTGAESGRDEEVACTFRRRIGEDRRLYFDEALCIEVIARCIRDLMTRANVLVHAGTTQVEIAIFKTQIFVGKILIEVERQHCGFVQHFEFGDDDLNLTCFNVGVGRAFEPLFNLSDELDDVFIAEFMASFCGSWILLRTEHDLGHALTVAQVHKDNATVISCGIDPTSERDGLADMRWAQCVAMVSAIDVRDHGTGKRPVKCQREGDFASAGW